MITEDFVQIRFRKITLRLQSGLNLRESKLSVISVNLFLMQSVLTFHICAKLSLLVTKTSSVPARVY